MSSSVGKYGPYVHQLNKGGLKEIITSGKLKGTEASNNTGGLGLATRASKGSVEHQLRNPGWVRYPERIWIEFYTDIEPDQHPAWAIWHEDKMTDGHLPIKISRIVRGDGTLHPDGMEILKIVRNDGPIRE